MVLPQEQDRIYTIDDIYELPEGTRAELIDGQIYYMAPPNRIHQKILNFVNLTIYNHIKSKNGPCEVYPAPFAVFIKPHDDRFYVEPDISVICDSNKLDKRGCKGAPDWIIEISSPGNSSHDYVRKLNLYLEYGVREYWIVNPKTQSVLVYFFESDPEPEKYTFKDKIKVNIYDDLYIDFNELDI